MCEELASAGLTPSVILHVNVHNGVQPNKPVSITLPFPADSSQGGKMTLRGDSADEMKDVTEIVAEEIMILQGEDGDDFKDVTEDVLFHISGQHVVFKVEHFTR